MPERDNTQYQVRVKVRHLIIEEFDDNGNKIEVEKTDLAGRPYLETKEVVLNRGDTLYLPAWKIDKLGTSVEKVMVPVARAPATRITATEVDEVTVSDLIPADEDDEEIIPDEDEEDLDLEEDGIDREPIED